MKELAWTVCFQFPDEIAYPNKSSGYQQELDGNVLVWRNKKDAEEFAKIHAGKYNWAIIPTEIVCKIY